MVRTYKGYASVAASATAAIQLDVRRNGRVMGIQIVLTPSTNLASGDFIIAEVSLYPSSQTQTNDGMGVLSTAAAGCGLATNGAISSTNSYKPCFGAQVQVGDRFYVHVAESGSTTWLVNVLIDVDEAG